MAYFYINKNQQANGDHEVHTTICTHPPVQENKVSLGYFDYCWQAVAEAKRKWPNVRINGCYYCAKPCHTT